MYWDLLATGLLIGIGSQLDKRKISVFRIPISAITWTLVFVLVPHVLTAVHALGALKALGLVALGAFAPLLGVFTVLFVTLLSRFWLAACIRWAQWQSVRFSMWRVRFGLRRHLRTIERSRRQVQEVLSACEDSLTRERLARLEGGLGSLASTVRDRVDNDPWRR